MIAIAMLVLIFALVVPVLLVVLRRWWMTDQRMEGRIRSPETHRLLYDVPNGEDPVAISAALAQAGFESVLDDDGGTERLVVACDQKDELRAREIIAHATSRDG